MAERLTGAEQIAAERQRQIDEEGYTAEHDAGNDEELARAGAAYALWAAGEPSASTALWPWDTYVLKPRSRQRDLVRAGALIAAAIDALTEAE